MSMPKLSRFRYIPSPALTVEPTVRKTTVLRLDETVTVTLSNGDINLPNDAKANVFNNDKPLEEYLLKISDNLNSLHDDPAASDVSKKTSVTGTAASVPTESASHSQSGTAAAASQTSDESAAGKIASGWVAAVAALAAVVVA